MTENINMEWRIDKSLVQKNLIFIPLLHCQGGGHNSPPLVMGCIVASFLSILHPFYKVHYRKRKKCTVEKSDKNHLSQVIKAHINSDESC